MRTVGWLLRSYGEPPRVSSVIGKGRTDESREKEERTGSHGSNIDDPDPEFPNRDRFIKFSESLL
jgi:hypothetical protein